MSVASATRERARRDAGVVQGLVGAVATGLASRWFVVFGDGVVRSPLPPSAAAWVSAGAAVVMLVGACVRRVADRVPCSVLDATTAALILVAGWALVVVGWSVFDAGGWLMATAAAFTAVVLAVEIRAIRRRRRGVASRTETPP